MPGGLRQSRINPMENRAKMPAEQTADALLLGDIKQGVTANFAIEPATQESRQSTVGKWCRYACASTQDALLTIENKRF